jgi:hypothetical protein
MAKVAAVEVVAHHWYLVLNAAFDPAGQVVPSFVPKCGSDVGGVDVKRKSSLAAVRQWTATWVPGMTAIAVLSKICDAGGLVVAPTPVGTAAVIVTMRIPARLA